jgi:hypothetical protein
MRDGVVGEEMGRSKTTYLWVHDPVHGRVSISEAQFRTLQKLPTEWTHIYEPNIVDRYTGREGDNDGFRIPLQVLKSLARKWRWAETDRRGNKLYARKTQLGDSVTKTTKRERIRRPDIRGISVL